MANTITGRVLEIGLTEQVPNPRGKEFLKRDLLLDCTRYDPYTGERAQFENIPLLEFGGEKGVAELENVKIGDIVTISFDITGTSYEKNGEIKHFTRIRPYKVEVRSARSIGQEKVIAPQLANRNEESPLPPDAGTLHNSTDDMPF
jgi:hypothetical protein